MPEDTDIQTTPHSDPRTGYRISNGPVVRFARSDPKLPNDLPEVIELPRVFGAPLLFVIETALGRNRFSFAKIRGASAPDPAVGLKIMYGFTAQ